jgi:dihydroxy-acid dehydratase
VSPEAAAGGPIGLLKPGDRIRIDIEKRLLEVELTEAEIKVRRAAWKPSEPRVKGGWLARYAKMVTSGSQGAVLKAD